MTPSLLRWIADADALMHLTYFKVSQSTLDYSHVTLRVADYYTALVGELFQEMLRDQAASVSWARLGNALSQFETEALQQRAQAAGISRHDAALFAACSFYCGGFPASAYLSIRAIPFSGITDEALRACYDMLARPKAIESSVAISLRDALRNGDQEGLRLIAATVDTQAQTAFAAGPREWIPARVLQKLVTRFALSNVRNVLPEGYNQFWTPLVESFLERAQPTWEFFPSQIAAINAGLLSSDTTFSLQMPTGSGKTTLCETLLYTQAKRHPDSVSVLVVPYRSLAAELRTSLVRNLNAVGISSRCAYGGTVPSADEVHALDETAVIVATPEALSGLLSADSDFLRRISLVICDEGHLLDGDGRGVGLELLLARIRARPIGAPRFVFVSAIIPNIEEINAWLGGTQETVLRSEYRPAIAEFAKLAEVGKGKTWAVDLLMHAHEEVPIQFAISSFLDRSDFAFTNPTTGRTNTYPHSSIKTLSISAARKALAMGAVAVFAANKRGAQGCIGLAEELLSQLGVGLDLPRPIDVANRQAVEPVAKFLAAEFGTAWVGTRAVAAGAIVHHGDIPQEIREILEGLLRTNEVKFVVCTSTLAEGVNLPIRTLVLYSVERIMPGGDRKFMLARDIKNLVGRAGRAGSNTKGLVICANDRHWSAVAEVAKQAPGEPVHGSLRKLMVVLRSALTKGNYTPTNELLETAEWCFPLLDGIDMTLLDLAAEEIGDSELKSMAIDLADKTFAASQATEESKQLLRTVFELRAARVSAIRSSGRLEWIRTTGARVRLVDSVESELLPRRTSWSDIATATDPTFVADLLKWAWTLPEVQRDLRQAFHLEGAADPKPAQHQVEKVVAAWLSGARYAEMATQSGLDVDDLLGIHTQVVTFALQTALEQGIALLQKLLESQGNALSEAATQLPEHLRRGSPTRIGCLLAESGVRHRHAFVQLGRALELAGVSETDVSGVVEAAGESLRAHEEQWRSRLGSHVYDNTKVDLKRRDG